MSQYDAAATPLYDAMQAEAVLTPYEKREARVPLVRATMARLFGCEPLTGIDPDLVVAVGAAVQGGITCITTLSAAAARWR